MIRLIRLEMHNFLSHKETVIDFSDYDGLTLIEGKTKDGHYSSNGSGKSTILEGVYYALTGKTLRGLTADAIVNRVTGKDTKVVLQFSLSQGIYTITRYRKHKEFQNNVTLHYNDIDQSSRLPTDTQKSIDDLINLPPDILSGVMILGEGMTSRFTQLSDPAKKSLLENTVRLSHDLGLAKDVTKNSIVDVVSRIKYTEGFIAANNKLLADYEGVDVSKVEEDRSLLSTYEEELSRVREQRSTLSESLQEIHRKISVLEPVRSKYSVLTSECRRYTDEESRLVQQLQSVMSSTPRCPTCNQYLQDPTVVSAQLSSTLQSVQSQITKTTEELSKLPPLDRIESKISELKNSIQEYQITDRCLASQESELISKMTELTRRITIADEKDRVIEDTKSKNQVLLEDLTSLHKEEEVLRYLEKNVFSSTGVIVSILANVVQYVDHRLQVYSELLLDKEFHLTFKKGKITIEGSSSSTYQSLSNGEKRRLDLSIQFALHDYVYTHCGIGFNTLFIDEVLDTLDTVGVSNIIEVLYMKKSYCSLSRIFVVTHNDELKEHFDSVLSVSKNADGLTYIV